MAKPDKNCISRLTSLQLEELRALAEKHLRDEENISTLSRNELIVALTDKSTSSKGLAREIKQFSVSIKPSFYLMAAVPKDEKKLSESFVKRRVNVELEKTNEEIQKKARIAPYKNFCLENTSVKPDLYEVQFSWEKLLWYLNPSTINYSHVYELRFGFIIIDPKSKKALLACQEQKEKEFLSKAISKALGIDLKSLVLTKTLLDQIGDFKAVKRAVYSLVVRDKDTPQNISYSDDELGVIHSVIAQEQSSKTERTQSFYRLPLGDGVEKGLGVTSSTGKLWIPRETALTSIREYGVQLLQRVTKTIASLSKHSEIESVLKVMGVGTNAPINLIQPVSLRESIFDLFKQLLNMLLNDESERYYEVPDALFKYGYSKYFQDARLVLRDPETSEESYFKSKTTDIPFVKLKKSENSLILTDFLGDLIDINNLKHPITGSSLTIDNPLHDLHFYPNHALVILYLDLIQFLSSEFKKLKRVEGLFFCIKSNKILLDLKRSKGVYVFADTPVEISCSDIDQLKCLKKKIDPINEYKDPRKKLQTLGEQCKSQSDANCQVCTAQKKYLCLRSLVASFFAQNLLLRHKGIERSDLQVNATIDGQKTKILFFAKQIAGKNSLTCRNSNGASLLAQVINQVESSDFHVVGIISPNTINEDLRKNLCLLCRMFDKKLLILDTPELHKMLVYFEDQVTFESADLQ